MSTKPKGYILYEGPSRLNGEPIVVVATLKTSNRKTGQMIQTWILCQDGSPAENRGSAKDATICGMCPHRAGTCYVNLAHAPRAIHDGYKRGIYPHATLGDIGEHFDGKAIRFGAYGDPAAAPVWLWRMLAQSASMHTGYTHQAAHPSFDPRLAKYVMVSADSPKQAGRYQKKGWRTFRVMNPGDTFLPNEIECLADSDDAQCADCGLCDGAGATPNVAITVHGAQAKNFKTANVIASTN